MILKKIVVQGDVTTPVDIAPHTNNLKRNGQFIGANMRMLEEFDLENIISESFKLFIVKDTGELTEEWIPALRVMVDMFNDGLNVKFSNHAVLDFIIANVAEFPATVKFLVQWQLQGEDTLYEGTDVVEVFNPAKGKGKIKGRTGANAEATSLFKSVNLSETKNTIVYRVVFTVR